MTLEEIRLRDLHEQLDTVERCARSEHGGGVRMPLFLALLTVTRGLVHEIDALRRERAGDV